MTRALVRLLDVQNWRHDAACDCRNWAACSEVNHAYWANLYALWLAAGKTRGGETQQRDAP